MTGEVQNKAGHARARLRLSMELLRWPCPNCTAVCRNPRVTRFGVACAECYFIDFDHPVTYGVVATRGGFQWLASLG